MKKLLYFDTECYNNIWMLATMTEDGRRDFSRIYDWIEWDRDNPAVRDHVHRYRDYTWVSFNGIYYDLPMISLALKNYSPSALKKISDKIIQDIARPWEILREHRCKLLKRDHIDIKSVLPAKGSLKLYGARLHCQKIQELPYHPDRILNDLEIEELTEYCYNDLEITRELYHEIRPAIQLRENLRSQADLDMRSLSDPQIGEKFVVHQLEQNLQEKISAPGRTHLSHIRVDASKLNLTWYDDRLSHLYSEFMGLDFPVKNGYCKLPENKSGWQINVNSDLTVKLGAGGLHSQEKLQIVLRSENTRVYDLDVASYYPSIIRNQGLCPKHLGSEFTKVYTRLIDRRLQAKREGDKDTSDSLKIVLNGVFGKFNSPYAKVYDPSVFLQITVSGQFLLLNLIDRLLANGISVISANTDGIVVKIAPNQEEKMRTVASSWSLENELELESTEYQSIYARDVNNYIAVTSTGDLKSKGAYLDRASITNKLMRNPKYEICVKAVRSFIQFNVPIQNTIETSPRFQDFLTVRTVTGGAVQNEKALGKIIRWYKTTDNSLEIRYAKSGNKVPESIGCRVVQELPDRMPKDLDYEYYYWHTVKLLKNLGISYQLNYASLCGPVLNLQ